MPYVPLKAQRSKITQISNKSTLHLCLFEVLLFIDLTEAQFAFFLVQW